MNSIIIPHRIQYVEPTYIVCRRIKYTTYTVHRTSWIRTVLCTSHNVRRTLYAVHRAPTFRYSATYWNIGAYPMGVNNNRIVLIL